MRRLSWVLWLLLAFVVVTPGLRFAYGGPHPIGFGSKAHMYREPFVRTPWISAPDSAFRFGRSWSDRASAARRRFPRC